MKTMKSTVSLLANFSILCVATFLFCTSALAQSKPSPIEQTYSVKPDYRKCAYPMCGGWFLTPVNQYSLYLTTEDEALQSATILPNSIYVAELNLKKLELDSKQSAQLNAALHAEQVLLRGSISTQVKPRLGLKITRLNTSAAWVGANKNTPVGTYLNVRSSGIMCITTPCPYYVAEIINSQASSNFDDLNLERAQLDRDQEAQAWQAVARDGLIITGVKFESKGQVGPGLGIAATKVFFAFPSK